VEGDHNSARPRYCLDEVSIFLRHTLQVSILRYGYLTWLIFVVNVLRFPKNGSIIKDRSSLARHLGTASHPPRRSIT
jgi:hypothetical protein